MNVRIVVPWHQEAQIESFVDAWKAKNDPCFVLQHDANREGCAVTKNKGIKRAMELKADIVIVLDSDCYPVNDMTVDQFINAHLHALAPTPVQMVTSTGSPRTRGTPYKCTTIDMQAACSMGFWTEIPDYDAVTQLSEVKGEWFNPWSQPKWKEYFPLCGMNIAFNPHNWLPWCQFIDVPRFDDIWMGLLWQKKAYHLGFCFNLNGPSVRHIRQSNVWQNLREESRYLEENDTLWKRIHECPSFDYETLRKLLPV